MISREVSSFLFFVLLCQSASAAFIFDLETFAGASFTNYSDISNTGLITGHYGDAVGNYTAFIYDGTTYQSFAVPGAWGTFARGINSSGVVVGEYGLTRGTLEGGAFIYDGSNFELLAFPGAAFTNFSDISDAGLITGHYGDAAGNYTAFTYDGATYQSFAVPGAWGTFARGVNSSGVVVGEYGLTRGTLEGGAFIYDGSNFQLVTFPGAAFTNFADISDVGLITGHYGDAAGNYTAFTYDGATYQSFAVPGAWGTFARGINASGVVVGEYGLNRATLEGGAFVSTPVPLPPAAFLMASGLVALRKKLKSNITIEADTGPLLLSLPLQSSPSSAAHRGVRFQYDPRRDHGCVGFIPGRALGDTRSLLSNP